MVWTSLVVFDRWSRAVVPGSPGSWADCSTDGLGRGKRQLNPASTLEMDSCAYFWELPEAGFTGLTDFQDWVFFSLYGSNPVNPEILEILLLTTFRRKPGAHEVVAFVTSMQTQGYYARIVIDPK